MESLISEEKKTIKGERERERERERRRRKEKAWIDLDCCVCTNKCGACVCCLLKFIKCMSYFYILFCMFGIMFVDLV
jgi:hypothetical protein